MTDPDRERASQRRYLLALAVVVLLFVVGWILARELYAGSRLEDCLMSGRTNCAPIDAPNR